MSTDDRRTPADQIEDDLRRTLATVDAIEAEFALDAPEDDSPDDSPGDSPEDGVSSLNDFPGFAPAPAHRTPHAPTRSDGDAAAEVSEPADSGGPRLSPAQILEAALFVGGELLSVGKLKALLGDGFETEFIERTLHELNVRYDDERRPYEIVFEDTGWRMALRPEFEPVRHKLYGYGPKEVRLSQEALEVLSLIAYRQPIDKEELESLAGSRPTGVVNQLLRRELITLDRDRSDKKRISYRTTPRFLQLFGLAHLDDLPQADDLYFK